MTFLAFLWSLVSRNPKTVAQIMGPITKIHTALHDLHVAAEADVVAAQAVVDASKAVVDEAVAAKTAVAAVLPIKVQSVG
jgi:predicted transcriptional regulator